MSGKVTIAGGGLAGLSLAAGLRLRGIPVEVHEAGCYPRHRVCGEFISGVAAATLEALGIRDALRDARRHRDVVWYRQDRAILEDRLPEPALGISRHRLDLRLRDRVIALGGTVHERSRLPREPREGQVWAAGRIPGKGPWIGLKCHFDELDMAADLEMHLGSNGYVGLAGIEDGRVNVCGLFKLDRSRRTRGPDLLADYLTSGGNPALAARLRAARRCDGSFSAVAGFKLGRQDAGPGLCVIGDAESMIAPFTGNGMSMAFQAAELSLDPLESWSRGRIGWSACVDRIQGALHDRFHRRLRVAASLHPVLLRQAGQAFIEVLSRSGALPFKPLLSLVR